MSGPVRVLIVSNGARNPFLEAWVACIRSSGATTTVLLDARRMLDPFVPEVLRDDVTVVQAGQGGDWVATIRERLGGDPQILFDYWGMGTLFNTIGTDTWPDARRVVCVDTFPNASRRRAELRDVAQSNLLLRRAHGLCFASHEMSRALARATLGRSRRLPASVVYSPFPIASHAEETEERSFDDRTLRLCFTGRSDHLFSSDPGMAKDAVGSYLERFIAAGAEVHVLDPEEERVSAMLLDRGFRFYPTTSRTGMTDGRFARRISGFHGHLVAYAEAGPVVRRRMESSLSTRFATAVCAPTPVVVPRVAVFADELFGQASIGFRADEPEEILERLRRDGGKMAQAWWTHHHRWAGEAYGPVLAEQWDQVLSAGRIAA